ncbi:retrovirus-related pol polyprotein from transposon TNT 1-94 [Tanacetum coccineum]
MTRSSNTKVFTPFANPERQFQSRKDITPIAVHNIYSFYESESSESESEDLNEIDIETLTLEQYLALNRNNSQVGVKRPGIEKNIVFEIKSQLLRELRENTFSGGKTEDAMEHEQPRDGLTDVEALESIQEIVEHSHRWHREESDKKTNSLSTITDKLKNLNHDMNNLRENIHKINLKSNMEFRHEEVKSMRARETRYVNQKFTYPFDNLKETFEQYLEESRKRQNILDKWMQNFMENTNKNLKRHESTIKKLEKKVVHLAHVLADQKGNAPVMNDIPYASTSAQQECIVKLEPPQDTPKTETFSKKELASNKIQIEELSMVKLNSRCSAVLQNKLPPKEKDPGSFVLPCIIGNTTVSNALADLGASISVMPFSMFKRLGLGNPRPVNMVIEMADRSMQSPKGIVENVLVKIHKFIFLVDFVILDIVEDNKVPIILGRPMLATAHARIDVFGGKISLEVGKEQVIFNANEGATPVTVLPVCAIKDFDVIDNIEGPDDLEEFLMDDDLNGDLGNFLQDNNLFPNYENPRDNPPFPNKSSSRYWNPVEEFQDSDDNLGIGIDDFIAIDDLWDNLDPGSLTNKQPLKP